MGCRAVFLERDLRTAENGEQGSRGDETEGLGGGRCSWGAPNAALGVTASEPLPWGSLLRGCGCGRGAG